MSTTTSSRLRRAFRYPSESDDDSPDELDEEHQERLIADLQAADARQNQLYRRAFVSIPLAAALYFCVVAVSLPSSSSGGARARLLALLSASGLVGTAYILHFMPLEAPERKGKRAVYRVEAEKGPLARYLVYMTALLVAVVQLVALARWARGLREDAWRESLPAIVFVLTMLARQQLAPVDLEELKRARYGLKGA